MKEDIDSLFSKVVSHLFVVGKRYAITAISLDLQDAGIGSRRRGTEIRVSPWASVSTGTLAEWRGVHFLKLRVVSFAHGEQATWFFVLASQSLQNGET